MLFGINFRSFGNLLRGLFGLGGRLFRSLLFGRLLCGFLFRRLFLGRRLFRGRTAFRGFL